jgi:hypothetical protein
VQVVDHLGQSITVPFAFCSKWEVYLFCLCTGQVTESETLGF